MFLKLTILLSFLDGEDDDEITRNFMDAVEKFKNEKKCVLLNVDNIHSITPIKECIKKVPLAKLIIKYKASNGEVRCVLVEESFDEIERKLT